MTAIYRECTVFLFSMACRAPEDATPEPKPHPPLPPTLPHLISEHESQAGNLSNELIVGNNLWAKASGFNNYGGARPKATNYSYNMDTATKGTDIACDKSGPSFKADDAVYATRGTRYHGVQHQSGADIKKQEKSSVVCTEFRSGSTMEQPNRSQRQFSSPGYVNVAVTATAGAPFDTEWTCDQCAFCNGWKFDECEKCMHSRRANPMVKAGNDKKSIAQEGSPEMKRIMPSFSSIKEENVKNAENVSH